MFNLTTLMLSFFGEIFHKSIYISYLIVDQVAYKKRLIEIEMNLIIQ